MRELRTIGAVGSPRAARAVRARSMHGLSLVPTMGSVDIGATNPSFQAPSTDQVQANPPGDALANAANALLIYMNSNGVPPESSYNAQVAAFQTAWNADPLGQVNGTNGTLQVDGGYGPNVQAALSSLSGGQSPAVNTSSSGNVASDVPLASVAGGSSIPWGYIAIAAALGLAAYLYVHRRRKGSGARRRSGSTVEVRSNPRRRRAA